MGEKAIAFVGAEKEALDGLPLMQRWLYMVLRWYMDRATGRVGEVRGISLQSLAEELYVEPVRGRHASECGSPSKKAIRSALDGLEKHGLIRPCGNGEVLVFFLIKARRAVARSKDEGHMRGTDEGHDERMDESRAKSRNAAYEWNDDGHTKNHDEGHTSRERVNHPSVQAAAPACTAPGDNPALLLVPLRAEQMVEWIRLQESQRGCAARLTSRSAQVADWVALAVTGEELHEAYSLAKGDREITQNPSPINLPFLDIFVRRVIAGRRVSSGIVRVPTPAAWWHSEAGIVAQAKALGIERRQDEPAERLRGRVDLALMHLEDADKQRRKAARKQREDELCPI